MLVNDIFGVIKLELLAIFKVKALMIFFKCFGPNFYILPESRFFTLFLCRCGCTTVYRIYLHRRGNWATDLQFV